jgi:hypothetical protein
MRGNASSSYPILDIQPIQRPLGSKQVSTNRLTGENKQVHVLNDLPEAQRELFRDRPYPTRPELTVVLRMSQKITLSPRRVRLLPTPWPPGAANGQPRHWHQHRQHFWIARHQIIASG